MTGIIRRIVARLASGFKIEGGEESRSQHLSPFLRARIKAAEHALSRVRIPGYDADLISSGVVVRFRVSTDGSKILVYLDYYGRNPGCSFCRFISDTLWAKIIKSARDELGREGFTEAYFIDAYTGSPIEPLTRGDTRT